MDNLNLKIQSSRMSNCIDWLIADILKNHTAFKMLVTIYQSLQHNIPEHLNLQQQQHCEHLKSQSKTCSDCCGISSSGVMVSGTL